MIFGGFLKKGPKSIIPTDQGIFTDNSEKGLTYHCKISMVFKMNFKKLNPLLQLKTNLSKCIFSLVKIKKIQKLKNQKRPQYFHCNPVNYLLENPNVHWKPWFYSALSPDCVPTVTSKKPLDFYQKPLGFHLKLPNFQQIP